MKQSLSKIFIFLALFFGSPSLALSNGHLPRCYETKPSASKAVRCIIVEKWDGVWDKNLWIGEAYWDAGSDFSMPSRDIGVWIKDGKVHQEGKFSTPRKDFKTPYSSPPYYFPSSKLKKLFATYSQIERKSIQTNLAFHGYYKSKIDGLYGKGTAAALKAYNKEYLGNANLTKSSNVKALLDDLLKEKPASLSADKCQGSDSKSVKCRPIAIIPKEQLLTTAEQIEATEPAAPSPLDFAKVKASYAAGNFSQAFKDAQTLSVEGNPDAQLYLGKMYADGRGTLQVTTSAHMWFNIASMNGSDEAFEERKTIQSQMTPELINEAQKMAVECIKSDYKNCGLLRQTSSKNVVIAQHSFRKNFQPSVSELRTYFLNQSVTERKQIHYALKKKGYYQSSVDGFWGAATQRALLNYIGSNQAVSEMSEIYTSLISEVDVPSSFAAPKTTSTYTANDNPPKKSAQGYTKAQAEAICAPKARLLANETENNRKKSSGSKTITCRSDSDLFTFGTNNRFGTSMGTTKCRESSGGGWPGLIPLLLETDPSSKARRAGEDAYQLAMESCMAQYGWF